MRIELFDTDLCNLVELSVTGPNEMFRTSGSESKFVEEDVFNLFISCFEKSNTLFDYYEPTQFTSRKIVPLINELKKNLENLQEQDTLESFTRFIDRKPLGSRFVESLNKNDPDWEKNWTNYQEQLMDINRSLISLVNRCLEEDKNLWVKGY